MEIISGFNLNTHSLQKVIRVFILSKGSPLSKTKIKKTQNVFLDHKLLTSQNYWRKMLLTISNQHYIPSTSQHVFNFGANIQSCWSIQHKYEVTGKKSQKQM